MRTFIFFFLLISYSLVAVAQKSAEANSDEEKLYIGVNITTVGYHIYYEENKNTGFVRSGYFTPISFALGYKLNKRASLQVSIGYGGDKDNTEWDGGTVGASIPSSAHSRTHAVAVPVSGQFVFFDAFKRFPVYGTASIMPAFGTTKSKVIKSGHTISDTKDSGMDIFATAGVGFNYKISKRFSANLEYLFFKKNITGENSYYYDWNQSASKSRRIYKSLALGINYGLKKQDSTK